MMMSPFQVKISGAGSSDPGAQPPGALTAAVGAKAARNSAKLKRSFASMLGQVKPEVASASSNSAGVKSSPGASPRHAAQPVDVRSKSKGPPPAGPSAVSAGARATFDSERRVDNSGEQERSRDLADDRRDGYAEDSSSTDHAGEIVPAWVGPPPPIEEASQVSFGAGETQDGSGSVEAEAMALAMTAEASSASGDESVGASRETVPEVVSRSEAGREAALPAALAAGGNADGKRTLPQDQDAVGAFKLPAGLNPDPAQPAPALATAESPRSLPTEKTAAQSSAANLQGSEGGVHSNFNRVEDVTNKEFNKANYIVGSVSAKSDANMFSPTPDFSAESASDAPAAEAVTRVNLGQVVDEVAAITETVRISGQQSCVVDLDVAGHGKLRVQVVRRAGQVETVLSTDSTFLRESLQAAFDRSDRSNSFPLSFQWQGSPDTSGRGQSGAQADADARQNRYAQAEPAERLGRTPSLPNIPVAPTGAPVLAANHRLQIFA